ncbi:MAG: hypothetical protein M3Y08_17740 [Fibrobacterota bacterium]|nr:hypothetical protein [Fibrobacterota bacterium]
MAASIPVHGASAPDRSTVPAPAQPENGIPESLDQARTHDLYNNGDFDPVVTVIESFVQRNKTYSQSDSIFIAKHLAVVYSANPATREKGKYYMFRLLELLPSAKLVDMYVSDEVDRIFDKVREEFIVRQNAFGVDVSRSLPGRKGKAADPEPKAAPKSHLLLWSGLAGGGMLLAAGGYLWYQSSMQEVTVQPREPVDVKVITPKN